VFTGVFLLAPEKSNQIRLLDPVASILARAEDNPRLFANVDVVVKIAPRPARSDEIDERVISAHQPYQA